MKSITLSMFRFLVTRTKGLINRRRPDGTIAAIVVKQVQDLNFSWIEGILISSFFDDDTYPVQPGLRGPKGWLKAGDLVFLHHCSGCDSQIWNGFKKFETRTCPACAHRFQRQPKDLTLVTKYV